jgi:hypothetical protein
MTRTCNKTLKKVYVLTASALLLSLPSHARHNTLLQAEAEYASHTHKRIFSKPALAAKPHVIFSQAQWLKGRTVLPFIDKEIKTNTLPEKFRKCTDNFNDERLAKYLSQHNNIPSRQGLDTLRVAGVNQFGEANLDIILSQFNGPVIVADLREENHGFINGMPVSYRDLYNWEFKNKAFKNPKKFENERLKHLKTVAAVNLHKLIDIPNTDFKGPDKGTRYSVSYVESEHEVVHRKGALYKRFYLSDHSEPKDQDIDKFLSFMRVLPSHAWVLWHCKGGKGRTSTMNLLSDILKNGRYLSKQEIFDRQALLNGYDVSKISSVAWKKQPAENRLKVAEDFYRYVNDPKGLNYMRFSTWRKKQTTASPQALRPTMNTYYKK